MPTTFTVFSLGNLADMDTQEGNTTAENASALVGNTFGAPDDLLFEQARTFSQGSTGFGGGTSTAYDMNNSPSETFRIDGGPEQVFDGTAVFNATITYLDGTTASISAVVFQDTSGNAYWAPEFSANADQTAMEAAPIRSLTLDSLLGNRYSGLSGSRETWNFVTCYAGGTQILTPEGERPIEELKVGDAVSTRDGTEAPVRWIGRTSVQAVGKMAPVRIAPDALGPGVPTCMTLVSRQHRMVVNSRIAERMFGTREILVPAISLVGTPGIDLAPSSETVDYFHLLLDRHEIIVANGALSESLYLGPGTRKALSPAALIELLLLFPDLGTPVPEPVRPIPKGRRLDSLLRRHRSNGKPLVESM